MGDKALVLKKLPPFDMVGSTWIYDYNLMGNKNTMVITCIKNDESNKNGIIHQNNMNQGSISFTNVEIKDDTIYYTKIKTVMDYDPDNPFISKYEKPLKIIKAPLFLGESWQDYDNILDAKVKREVIGLENITVKAGIFSAVKIKVDYIKQNKNESFGYFEWWSEDVGIIKSSNMELELKKYEHSESIAEKIVHENQDNLKQELSKEQLLALAMAGMYAEYNNGNHNSLLDRAPSEEGIKEMKKSLDEAWGVYNNYDLNETLLWLLDTGHRKRYDYESKNHNTILAWDLCRLINLVRFGAYSEYITEKDAWQWIMSAASYLKAAFKSWEELIESYMKGRHYWICLIDEIEWKEDEWENFNDDEQEVFNNIFNDFLNKNNPESLWIKNKWIHDPNGNKKGDELKKEILNNFNQNLYNNEISYFQRNNKFWDDFNKHKNEIEKSIDNKQHEQSSDIITYLVYSMIPGMAFLYGFNNDTKKYELFLSYAGDKNNMILAKYWKENSPKIKNWDFFSSKQPANIANYKLKIYDIEIDPKDLMVRNLRC